MPKCNRQENLQQNTICLEQETYTSSEKFTQALLVKFQIFGGYGKNIFKIYPITMLLLCAISQAQVRFLYLVLINILNNPKLELSLIAFI